MTFIEAIKTGLPLTRKDRQWSYLNEYTFAAMTTHVFPNTLIDSDFLIKHIRLTKEDMLADDWFVQGFTPMDYETVE